MFAVALLVAPPIPMRKQVHHGGIGPLALVEVVGVLGKIAEVDDPEVPQHARPAARFPDVVEPGPPEPEHASRKREVNMALQ